MSIQVLSAQLANQIAAGEVVERPASIVKELVENSIDAGATKIDISIEQGGHKRILITDNGSGIVKDELALALSRHATSKITSIDDLSNIGSLGFRGEALASISSVARLTLTAKPASQSEAWQVHTEGRDMDVVMNPAAHPEGASVDVVDLFFNTPARRKFLKTHKTEFTHIDELIKRIALAHSQIGFKLTHNGKVIRHFPKQSMAQRVDAVCGKGFTEQCVYVDRSYQGTRVSGWLTKPMIHRNQNDVQYSFVNGRMMRDKLINHAVRQAYEGLIDNQYFPGFVVFIDVPNDEVDVNVHPAKHEVRFVNSRIVHDFLYQSLVEALNASFSDVAGVDYADLTVEHDYITPLQAAPESSHAQSRSSGSINRSYNTSSPVSTQASTNYTRLLQSTAGQSSAANGTIAEASGDAADIYHQVSAQHAQCMLLAEPVAHHDILIQLSGVWLASSQALVASWLGYQSALSETQQPLLLPVAATTTLTDDECKQCLATLNECGFVLDYTTGHTHQQKWLLKKVPSLLRALPWSRILPDLLTILDIVQSEQQRCVMLTIAQAVASIESQFEPLRRHALHWFAQQSVDDQLKFVQQYAHSAAVQLLSEST